MCFFKWFVRANIKKFVDNLNIYKDDLSNLFKLFLDTVYDESDDFFDNTVFFGAIPAPNVQKL